mgnify:FL=1
MSNDISLYIQNNKTSPVFIILYVNDLVISREYIVDFNKVKMLLLQVQDKGFNEAVEEPIHNYCDNPNII